MSNSKRVVQEIERKITRLATNLRTGGWSVIETVFVIGEALIEGEAHIPARQLGRWEKANFGWSKSKTARFRRLARHADLIIAEYNKGTAGGLPNPPTITGVDTWAQKATGSFKARTKTTKTGVNGSTSDTNEADDDGAETANEIANLRRELREAPGLIQELRKKLARLSDTCDEDISDVDIDDVEIRTGKSDQQGAYANFKLWWDAAAERGA